MDFLFLTNNQHLGLNAVVVWHPGRRSRSALGLQAIASIAWRGETCNLCTEGSGGRVSRGGLDPRTGPGPSWVSHRGFVWQWELGGANGWGGRGGKWKIPFCLNRFWEKELMNEGWFRKRWMDGLVKFLSKVRYLLTEEDPVQWEDSGSLREAPRIFTILASEAFRASCTTASWRHYLHRIPEVFLRIPKSSLWKDPGSFHCHLFCGKVNMFGDAWGH